MKNYVNQFLNLNLIRFLSEVKHMSDGGWSEWLQARLAALGEEMADEAIIEYIDSIVQLEEVSA